MLAPVNFGDTTTQVEFRAPNRANLSTSVPPTVHRVSISTEHAHNDRVPPTVHGVSVRVPTEHARNDRVPPAIQRVTVPTEHAHNDRARGGTHVNNTQSNSTSSTSSNPLAALFDVPIPMTLSHYPLGSGVHVQRATSANSSLAEQTARERQRLEQSTAFIASRSQDRITSSSRRTSSRRRGGRRRESEQTETQPLDGVHQRSSTRRHVRDRSPISTSSTTTSTTNQRSLASSLLSQGTRRRGADRSRRGRPPPPPLLATEQSVPIPPPPPNSTIHVPTTSTTTTTTGPASRNFGSSDHRQQYIGYQIVPQAQTSNIFSSTSASSDVGAHSRPPLPRMNLSQRQRVGMPPVHVASNVCPFVSSLRETPRQGGAGTSSSGHMGSSEITLSSPHSDVHVAPQVLPLLGSHSSSLFHPPSTSSHILPSTSHSHIPFHSTSSPISVSFHPITIIDSPQQINDPTIIVDSLVDHEVQLVPRSSREIRVGMESRNSGVSSSRNSSSGVDRGERRDSLVEVIVVDSSDSEHEVGK